MELQGFLKAEISKRKDDSILHLEVTVHLDPMPFSITSMVICKLYTFFSSFDIRSRANGLTQEGKRYSTFFTRSSVSGICLD